MAEQTAIEKLIIRRGVSKKLAMWVGLAGVLVGLSLLIILLPLERRAMGQAASDQVGLLAGTLVTSYIDIDEANGRHPERVVRRFGDSENVLVAEVLNKEGVVVQSSNANSIGQERTLPKEVRSVEIRNEEIHVTTKMPWTRQCIGCHQSTTGPVGAIHIAVSRKQTLESLERFHLAGGFGILLGFLALTALLIYATDKIVSRPVFRLARVMQKASQGDFLVRARHTSDDELGALVRVFNSMLKNITSLKATEIEREADLRQAREELTLKAQLEETNHALERRVRAQSLLMEAAHRLSSTLDKEALLSRLDQIVVETFGVKDSAIFLVELNDEGEAVLRPSRTSGATVGVLVDDIELGVGITGWVAETGAPYRITDIASTDGRFGAERDVLQQGTTLAIPMLHKGRVLGVMSYFSKDRDAYDDDDIELLQALASQAAMAVVNAELHEKTVELSVTDPLTGLMNRRALEKRLEIELIRARRFSMPLSVLMIDVDHFKAYNDRMGHLLGDRALVKIADSLNGTVRKVDGVARFGGEEFAVFLPRTDLRSAIDVAEKLRLSIEEIQLPGAESQPFGFLSVSIGISVYPEDMPPALDDPPGTVLMNLADKALYVAKQDGRNRHKTGRDIPK